MGRRVAKATPTGREPSPAKEVWQKGPEALEGRWHNCRALVVEGRDEEGSMGRTPWLLDRISGRGRRRRSTCRSNPAGSVVADTALRSSSRRVEVSPWKLSDRDSYTVRAGWDVSQVTADSDGGMRQMLGRMRRRAELE